SGANTYTGSTTVSTGTLLATNTTGTANGTGTVTVGGAGTLGGSGKVGTVVVNAGGTLAPGTVVTAILNSGNVTFASGSFFNAVLNGTTAGAGYTQLNATGTVALNGAMLNVSLTAPVAVNDTFTIVQATGALTGTFAGLTDGTTFTLGADLFKINYS